MKKETINLGQITIDFLLEAGDTGGAAAVFEFTVPPGAKVPSPHYHDQFDEVIYGITGVMTFTVGDKAIDIAPGDVCFVPRGVVHGFNNSGQTEAKALATITPGLLGPDYFKELAGILKAGGPPDIEKVKAVMAKHGLIPVMA